MARPTLITVPSCAPCNTSASLDDEYFRSRVVMHRERLGIPTLVRTRPDKSARRPVVGQASPHDVHVVYFRQPADDHRQTEMSSQAAPRRRELATSDPVGIGVPTDQR
jgi:hypothetical protein